MSTQNETFASVAVVLKSDEMRSTVEPLLPPGVSYDRFTQTTIAAIQANPDVLSADRSSLYTAVQRAAADGLMPDGKEGAMVVFNKKQGNAVTKVVQWMPMVEGIIKQMGKAGIKAYAVSVYEGEEFQIWNDDEGQHVMHKPNPWATQGAALGVFACARFDGQTYIEALNKEDIEKIRNSSRAANGGPWAAWPDRMAQKSALHRLKKRLPILDPAVAAALRDPEEDGDIVSEQPEPAADAPVQKTRPRGLAKLVKLTPETVEQVVSQERVEIKLTDGQMKAPSSGVALKVTMPDDDEGEVF